MSDNSGYAESIEIAFKSAGDPKRAAAQSAYMRNQFSFFGIMANERKEILKPFLRKENRPNKEDLESVVKILWRKPEREMHYAAQELASKYLRETEKKDIEWYEWMITNKSWWDTVDFIAATLAGNYFQKFPDERDKRIKDWLESENIWLQRATLIFQLKYKDQVDSDLLASNIHHLVGTNEFFINKAIGWALREYGKINPEWVIDFTNRNDLNKLSRREALKHID
jgi:3-methyladenine DNA glycosylase AlkD